MNLHLLLLLYKSVIATSSIWMVREREREGGREGGERGREDGEGKGEGGRKREGGREEGRSETDHRSNGAAQTTHAQFDFRIPHVRRDPPRTKTALGVSVWLLLSLLLPVCRISLR